MGFMNKILGGKKGIQCSTNQDGSKTCDVFSIEGDQKVATGTHLNLTQDPSSCEVMMSGDTSIVDGDEEEIRRITDSMKQGCRKGIA